MELDNSVQEGLSFVADEEIIAFSEGNTGLGDAIKNGTITADLRAMYFDRSFDKDKTGKDNATSITAGGILRYESEVLEGFKFAAAAYSSSKLGGLYTREEAAGTSNLGRDGENLAFLGEANLQYDFDNTMIKIGRQQLSTPLIQNHDLRMLPSVYEAAIIRNKDIPDTTIEAGYIDKYTGFTSKENDFIDDKVGEDGLAYLSVSNKSIPDVSLRAQYVKALTDTNERQSYGYADLKYNLSIGDNTYVKAQAGMNEYLEGENSTLLGGKIGTTLADGAFDVAAVYDKITGNKFQAFESGPMYTDWQQGYGPYEPSTGIGAQVTFKPTDDMSVKVGYVKVESDTMQQVDDFTELNIDAKYIIDDDSSLRVRYSAKDQSIESKALHDMGNGGREDRDDLRVIYEREF